MHEAQVADAVIRSAQVEALARDAARITSVRLAVGIFAGVDTQSLSFCLEAMSSGTMMDNATVEIVRLESETVCANCGRLPFRENGGDGPPVCRRCNCEAKVEPATEIFLEEMNIDEQETGG